MSAATPTFLSLKNPLYFSGKVVSAMMLQERDERIVYMAPEEGSMLWSDYLLVLKNSPRKDLAFVFIDWLIDPVRAARIPVTICCISAGVSCCTISRTIRLMPNLSCGDTWPCH